MHRESRRMHMMRGRLGYPIHRLVGALVMVSLLMAGCSGTDITGTDAMTTLANDDQLTVASWQIEDIDGDGIVDRSSVTLQVNAEGELSGSTGCNSYFGTARLDANEFVADGIGSTRRACAPALMQQEQQFLNALGAVRRYEVNGDIARLFDATDVARLRMIRADNEPATP